MNQEIEAVTSAKKKHFVGEQHSDNVEQCPEWDILPYPAMVEVFRHLRDNDRVKMSQVCRKFNNVFRDPSLWKKRKFIIDRESDIKHIHFTSKYGSCLEKVVLDVWHGESNSCKIISQTLMTLLENIKKARLRDFEVRSLKLNRFKKFPEDRDILISCLKKLFQTQNGLRKIALTSCKFSQSTGTELLETLAISTGYGLRYIELTDFLHRILNVYDLEKFKETLKIFSNLTYIGINYSYLSDEVLRHWAVSLRQKLELIDITASDREPQSHTISSGTWKELCKSCPKLKVILGTMGLCLATEITHLLQPTVPLSSFLMIASMRNEQKYQQLSLILKHLATCFKDSLDDVSFSFGEMDYTPDDELVCLIERCHKLQSFRYLGNCGIAVPNAIGERLKNSDSVLYKAEILLCGNEYDPEIANKINLIHVVLDEWDYRGYD